jgi:surfeit locus 1 family protein
MTLRSRPLLFVAFLVVAAVCARLGLWQVHRLESRRAANSVSLAARSAPPVPLEGRVLDSTLLNHRVTITGHYDHAHDIVLRGREYRGVPGVEVVSPLLSDNAHSAILVNRGFLPAPDAVTADPARVEEPGVVRVAGIALPLDSSQGAPLERGRYTTWARLNRSTLQSWLGYPVAPFYIRQTPDSSLPQFPRRLEPPPLDDGPHLSYAIQWFAFSIIALVFAGIAIKRDF